MTISLPPHACPTRPPGTNPGIVPPWLQCPHVFILADAVPLEHGGQERAFDHGGELVRRARLPEGIELNARVGVLVLAGADRDRRDDERVSARVEQLQFEAGESVHD